MPHVQGVSSQTFQTSDFPCNVEEVFRCFVSYQRVRPPKISLCPLDRKSKAALEVWSNSCWIKLWTYATDKQHSLEQALLGHIICKCPALSLALSSSASSCSSLGTLENICVPEVWCGPWMKPSQRTGGSALPFKPVAWSKAQRRDSTEVVNRGINVYFLHGNLAWLGMYTEVGFNSTESRIVNSSGFPSIHI